MMNKDAEKSRANYPNVGIWLGDFQYGAASIARRHPIPAGDIRDPLPTPTGDGAAILAAFGRAYSRSDA